MADRMEKLLSKPIISLMAQIVGHNKWWMTNRKDKYKISSLAYHIQFTIWEKMSAIIFDTVRLHAVINTLHFPRYHSMHFNIEFEIREWKIIFFLTSIISMKEECRIFEQRAKLVAFAIDNITDSGHMFYWNVTYKICNNLFNLALRIVLFESIVKISC